jgi:hypothetical protein
MTKPLTFEEYLQEVHAEDYHGTDDDMPDSFDSWLADLDSSEMLELGEKAIIRARDEAGAKALEEAVEVINEIIRDREGTDDWFYALRVARDSISSLQSEETKDQ